ncbi:sensor histidine kinase [Bacillus solimangrovi]|uniref:histidine kinase n=1 Tax=Bacillus solimangrovi TaxID=1305675 RepID=A0A1E5LIX2_9BACI|nr:ATP-binding protein [Bacillus solimangrovi]OEH94025.1 two-component sensor histidine kinase [Bacillus solimangrovi]
MKYVPKSFTLSQKLGMTVLLLVGVSVIFSFAITNVFYEKLYVEQIETSLLEEGKKLANEYTGGSVTEQYKQKVELFNRVSNAEVFVVNNPRELSACLPFDVAHQSIIGEKERRMLIQGQVISKVGYEPHFNRSIMGVIVPLLDEERLNGILYIYLPLVTIDEIFKEAKVLVVGISTFVISLVLLVGRLVILKLTKPLHDMERIAYKMSQGQFEEKVPISTTDEIGRLGAAFNQMADAVKEEDERRKEFLGNVSHELRTPISYLKGYSGAILDGLVQTKEQEQKYLEIIYHEADRMKRLVEDLLELTKIDNNAIELQENPLVFAQLIEETLVKFEYMLNEKQLTLHKGLDVDVIVMGDEDRLSQVLYNLIDNAIRYTPREGSIHVTLENGSEQCTLQIIDTGVGIPHDKLERIGERFYRVDKARSREHGGTGLGMAIVKKIVHQHHGEWKIESVEGEGTTITVRLPIFK